jgi:hypothetical protein
MLHTPDREGAMTLDAVKTRARPTGIRPQLQTSSVISGDELPLLERLFDLACWAVIRVQS